MRARVIVNRGGGTFAQGGDEIELRLRDAFAAAGVDAEIRMTDPEGIPDAFAAAATDEGLDAVVAAGGDGTISTAAGHLAGTERPLGIIPLGTLNHLARDAGLPNDIEAAVAVIAAGRSKANDVAEVNGRIFVNNSAVGLYPDMVMLREVEQARTGHGKRRAMLAASLASLRHFRRHRLWISAPGLAEPLRTPLLFVGNNRYQVRPFALGTRERIDEGVLCIYAVKARSRGHLLWAGIKGIFGRLDAQEDFLTAYVAEAEITADHPAMIISADGETFRTETPLRYRVRPKALKLLVPAD